MDRAGSFWDFSVSTYRRPGVADACLSLQDRFGFDINLLLYCCWFGCTRGCLAEEMFNTASSFSQSWADEVVRPLRGARTWMKSAGCGQTEVSTDDCMSLRDKIKAAEFEAEHLQQGTLEGLTSTSPADTPEPREQIMNTALNLRRYLNYYDARLDGASLSELAHIVTAAIDGADEQSVVATLDTTFQET